MTIRHLRSLVLSVALGLGLLLPGVASAAETSTGPTVTFRGAVDVDGCSGSVVRGPRSTADDRALLLTAGHCTAGTRPVPDEVLVDEASSRLVTALAPSGAPAASLRVRRALYVTMTGTDVALYELRSTYRQLAARFGVRPLTLATGRPAAGDPIHVVAGSQRRVFGCRLDGFAYRLLESGYVAKDALRYGEGCETRAGSSGSPVLAGGRVVAVNSTSNGGGESCTEDNPCEMARDGRITAREGASYGTPAWWLTPCLARGNTLHLDAPGCRLPRPDRR